MGAQGVGTTGDQCRRALDGSTQNVYAGMQPERSEATLYSYETALRMYSCEEQLGRCVQCQSWQPFCDRLILFQGTVFVRAPKPSVDVQDLSHLVSPFR